MMQPCSRGSRSESPDHSAHPDPRVPLSNGSSCMQQRPPQCPALSTRIPAPRCIPSPSPPLPKPRTTLAAVIQRYGEIYQARVDEDDQGRSIGVVSHSCDEQLPRPGIKSRTPFRVFAASSNSGISDLRTIRPPAPTMPHPPTQTPTGAVHGGAQRPESAARRGRPAVQQLAHRGRAAQQQEPGGRRGQQQVGGQGAGWMTVEAAWSGLCCLRCLVPKTVNSPLFTPVTCPLSTITQCTPTPHQLAHRLPHPARRQQSGSHQRLERHQRHAPCQQRQRRLSSSGTGRPGRSPSSSSVALHGTQRSCGGLGCSSGSSDSDSGSRSSSQQAPTSIISSSGTLLARSPVLHLGSTERVVWHRAGSVSGWQRLRGSSRLHPPGRLHLWGGARRQQRRAGRRAAV